MTSDEAIRKEALDLNFSFIVQAPAGSGKTELLIQRYLALLAKVNFPEEIIAITFTRKAAAEMRQRVVSALEEASLSNACAHTTAQLAVAAWKQNLKQGWQLTQNTNRFRILTIDALVAAISKQTPLFTGVGTDPIIVDNATYYYQKAIREYLLTKGPPKKTAAIEFLLLHLDNQFEQLEQLLEDLLCHRDQWLSFIIPHHNNELKLKAALEQGISAVLSHKLNVLLNLWPQALKKKLLPLLQFACNNLRFLDQTHPLCTKTIWTQLPKPEINELAAWRGLVSILLTKNGQWRKTQTASTGFPNQKECSTPTVKKEARIKKEEMKQLMTHLSSQDQLRNALSEVLYLPDPHYTKEQWHVMDALLYLLPFLVSQLKLIFLQEGIVDFTELTLGVIQAFGAPQSPTDYALYLDYQIKHILIDEFQDTSTTQYILLKQLIEGWQPHDGRTLFLVGDPFQSIYRFRDAEINLFMQVKKEGIAGITLKHLTLKSNFRSSPKLVDWFNRTFKVIFSKKTINVPELRYEPALPHLPAVENQVVNNHFLPNATAMEEAQHILTLIKNLLSYPKDTISILVRSRYQLKVLIPLLKAEQIPFNALDIEPLSERPEIQDILSLIRALTHFGDRLAWLSILRAPWCGLNLQDLKVLSICHPNAFIWDNLIHHENINGLSEETKHRLARIVPILANSLYKSSRFPGYLWIKGTWLALGGPATLLDKKHIKNVDTFFNLLSEIDIYDTTLIKLKLKNLYASTYGEKTNLQIMTIHKAKGLEFDHVILPSLQDKAFRDKNPLLLWFEYPPFNHLIVSPLPSTHKSKDALYDFLKKIEKEQAEQELARLFYVATTRAKKNLYLFARIQTQKKINSMPNTFLNLLQDSHDTLPTDESFNKTIPTLASSIMLDKNTKFSRLSKEWKFPLSYAPINIKTPELGTAPIPSEVSDHSRVGVVVHEALEQLSKLKTLTLTSAYFQKAKIYWRKRLLQLGVFVNDIEENLEFIVTALRNITNDAIGRWILSPLHKEAQSEYRISGLINQQFVHYVIDRTFIDKNYRWIIDYKTTELNQSTSDDFLVAQKKIYTCQLNQYATLIKEKNKNLPIKLGLYFPLIPLWYSWDFER